MRRLVRIGWLRQSLANPPLCTTTAILRTSTAIPAATAATATSFTTSPSVPPTPQWMTAAATAVCTRSSGSNSSRIIAGGPAETGNVCEKPQMAIPPHAVFAPTARGSGSCFTATAATVATAPSWLIGSTNRLWYHKQRQNQQHQQLSSRGFATDTGGGGGGSGRRTDVKGAFGKPKKKNRPYRASKWHILSNKNIQVSQSPGEIFQELEVRVNRSNPVIYLSSFTHSLSESLHLFT